jgi:two-component system LytT family response regulator
MTSCYIIDDELHAIQVLAGYVNKTPGLELAGSTENPLEGLNEFREKGYADITFVDIDMAQLSGIEVATLIGNKTSVVFTTAFPKYAVEAFEKDASDYILKPITYERFLKCINKITARIGSKKENDFFYIQCESKGKIIKLNYDDIIFVEALKNYVSIHTADNKHLTYLTLKEMEGSLPPNRF